MIATTNNPCQYERCNCGNLGPNTAATCFGNFIYTEYSHSIMRVHEQVRERFRKKNVPKGPVNHRQHWLKK